MGRHGPPGRVSEWPVGICGTGAVCDAPDWCAVGRICVEPGTTATPYVFKAGDPNDPGPPRKPSGCSIGREPAEEASLGWAMWMMIGTFLLGIRRTRWPT